MNTAKQWMKAGRTLGLVLLTVQTAHAEPRQVTSPAATRCIGVAVYESAIKTAPRAACSRRQALRAIAIPAPPAVRLIAEPAVQPYLPSTPDTRRYSF